MTELDSKVRRACQMYGLIEDGDRIAVGLSGGKDSTALLWALAKLRGYNDKRFELVGLTIDPCFGGKPGDYSSLTRFCESLGVEHHVKTDNIYQVVFEIRKESNPCSLCARLRRGGLNRTAKELGCNKVALGHHLDDASATFWMNFVNEGRFASFSPKTYLDRSNVTLIRPLVLCREKEVERAVKENGLPVIKSGCPVNKLTERQRITEFMERLGEGEDMPLRTFKAMQKSGISGFGTENE